MRSPTVRSKRDRYSLALVMTLLLQLVFGSSIFAQEAAARPGLVRQQNTPQSEQQLAGNPVFEGWYADPEGIIFGDTYWIYPTYSAPYDEQVFFDCFSSKDLVTWKKHSRILDADEVKWAHRAMWAPSIVEKGGKYFFFFGANN